MSQKEKGVKKTRQGSLKAKSQNTADLSKHYLGHRQRLREKVLLIGSQSLTDMEILESVLFLCVPRKDTKIIAKELFAYANNSLAEILELSLAVLTKKFKKTGENLFYIISLFKEFVSRALFVKATESNKEVFESWNEILEYLLLKYSNKTKEMFRVLALDSKNRLLKDIPVAFGTTNQVNIYSREIIEVAINSNASSVVLMHNHPSGDPTPSKADLELTKNITALLKPVNVKVYDHIIIANADYFSFREESLMISL